MSAIRNLYAYLVRKFNDLHEAAEQDALDPLPPEPGPEDRGARQSSRVEQAWASWGPRERELMVQAALHHLPRQYVNWPREREVLFRAALEELARAGVSQYEPFLVEAREALAGLVEAAAEDEGLDDPSERCLLALQELERRLPAVEAAPEVRAFAAAELKGKQRAVVEAVCDGGGEMPLADLAVRPDVEWGARDFDDSWNSLKKAVKAKLRKVGYQLERNGNAARLVRLTTPRQK
jgi:hypothetical protein